MNRNLVFAIVVLVGVAAFAGYTLFSRMHDGRCRLGGGLGRRRAAIDCSYAPGTFPAGLPARPTPNSPHLTPPHSGASTPAAWRAG